MTRDQLLAITFIFVTAFIFRQNARNIKVRNFCRYVVGLGKEWDMRHIDEIYAGKELSAYEWLLPAMPTYERMLFSYRPLTLERWIDKKIIEKLKS